MTPAIERDRSDLKHAQAGLAVALGLIRELYILHTTDPATVGKEQWCAWLERTVRFAGELLQVASADLDNKRAEGERAGEPPPIPPATREGAEQWNLTPPGEI